MESERSSQEDLANMTIVAVEPDISEMRYLDLRAKLGEMGLRSTGKKKELAERLRAAREKRLRQNDGDDDDDDSEEEEAESSVDEISTKAMQMLTFKNVEESLQTFSGDDTLSVKRWMRDFEDMAEVCQWDSTRKIIYCRRLLRGSARSFVRYEKCGKSWKQLKKALLNEFAEVTSAYKVHELLRKRTKKAGESYQEYIYTVCEIAAQGGLDRTSTIQYIVDGIEDEPFSKMILYGATTISELKQKFTFYEAMKEELRKKSKTPKVHKSKETEELPRGSSTRIGGGCCCNCGESGHRRRECPFRTKSVKCCRCDEFGHVSKDCQKNIKPQETPKQNQVYEELYDLYGSSDTKDVSITMEDTKKMKYLERVIKETLRLFPVCSLIARTLSRDTKVNDNVVIPKNCNLVISIFTLHRKDKYWNDPLRFNPDRFLPGNFNSKCFIPFSFGKRGCIGQIFAMIQMKVIAATLLRKFTVRIDDPVSVENIDLKFGITLQPAETIFLRFTKR
ncbi:licodione synthase-like isoform X3 [Polistes fuscatus]|uniref:licodione synthase-like isoform X3 n=1 Tax=Polistes fuscatus TaxID=30207 RepID=UPI001CA8F41E|nr:licodione synthase-like isoform X3 [Polistes fuscatus]